MIETLYMDTHVDPGRLKDHREARETPLVKGPAKGLPFTLLGLGLLLVTSLVLKEWMTPNFLWKPLLWALTAVCALGWVLGIHYLKGFKETHGHPNYVFDAKILEAYLFFLDYRVVNLNTETHCHQRVETLNDQGEVESWMDLEIPLTELEASAGDKVKSMIYTTNDESLFYSIPFMHLVYQEVTLDGKVVYQGDEWDMDE